MHLICPSNMFKNEEKYVCTDSRSMAILNAVRIIYSRFMPHLLMILVQIGYSFLYTIAEAVFNHGMNPHVFVTYR
jgi:hypothetical protein